MRSAKIIVAAAVISVASMTGTALAGSSYPPSPGSDTVVKGAGPGSTAFTGGGISGITIALVVLVALGVIALVAARAWPRRSERSDLQV